MLQPNGAALIVPLSVIVASVPDAVVAVPVVTLTAPAMFVPVIAPVMHRHRLRSSGSRKRPARGLHHLGRRLFR